MMSFTYLRETLQALAAPPDVQLARFPDFVVKADELALDFDHALLLVRQEGGEALSVEQHAALSAVDGLLDAMSGAENASLWTEQALREDPEWDRVRAAAAAALRAFGWPVELPPPTQNVYVSGAAG
jgi:hypothetical protein